MSGRGRIAIPAFRGGIRQPRAPRPPRSINHRTNTWSVFFVTINSNKTVQANSQVHHDLLVRVCQDATEHVFDDNGAAGLVRFRPGWETDSYAQNVGEYRFSGAVEVGSRQNLAVHSHVTVLIRHNSSILLDRDVIAERFKARWNALCLPRDRILTRPYVNIVAASHNVANWVLYQQKDQADIPVQTTDPVTGRLNFTGGAASSNAAAPVGPST
jgi:hypothetical protein